MYRHDPSLLAHPNIPKPLHGIAPREVKGKKWWDEVRKRAYAEHDNHCMSCGRHMSKDRYRPKWLEAHEAYDIDYKTGRVQLKKVVALCHTCHNFIHSGRLASLWQKKKIGYRRALHILDHGFTTLRSAGLEPYHQAADLWLKIQKAEQLIHPNKVEPCQNRFDELRAKQPSWELIEWSKWHMVIDGEAHYSKFADINEWQEFYDNK